LGTHLSPKLCFVVALSATSFASDLPATFAHPSKLEVRRQPRAQAGAWAREGVRSHNISVFV